LDRFQKNIKGKKMFEKILICLDGSKLAEQIVPQIAESCLPKSEAILLQVVNSYITVAPPQSVHIPPLGGKINPKSIPVSDIAGEFTMESEVGPQLAAIEKEQEVVQKHLESLAAPLRARGLKVTTLILQGEAGDTIVHWAAKHAVTLIALTSHGQDGLERGGFGRDAPLVLKSGLGRVAQEVLKGSALPVLIIKPKAP
jgi:nucleotide-binding universal stress UspA family protein